MQERSLTVTEVDKKEGLLKHVFYTIQGYDEQGDIKVSRRYKDFISLRKILALNWPGCIIPSIPPKQMLVTSTQGSLEAQFIERRKRLLDRFIKLLVEKDYLYTSDEFQKFIRLTGDYFKHEFHVSTYIEIGEAYHKIFAGYERSAIEPELQEKVQDYLNFSSTSLPAFENLEKMCRVSVESFYRYDQSAASLITGLENVGLECMKMYGSLGISPNERGPMNNSFEILLDWARGEILDIKAVIEAITKHLAFKEIALEYQKRLEKKMKKLEDIKQGKKTLKDLFTNKSKDAKKKEGKKSVEFLEYEVKGIETIEKINLIRLLEFDLPEFKRATIDGLAKAFKGFGDSLSGELNRLKYQAMSIRYDE